MENWQDTISQNQNALTSTSRTESWERHTTLTSVNLAVFSYVKWPYKFYNILLLCLDCTSQPWEALYTPLSWEIHTTSVHTFYQIPSDSHQDLWNYVWVPDPKKAMFRSAINLSQTVQKTFWGYWLDLLSEFGNPMSNTVERECNWHSQQLFQVIISKTDVIQS